VDKFSALNPVGRSLTGSPALLTYEPYYGLREKPFSLSTDPRFLYHSAAHAGTFEDLLLAIRRREGLIVLTGDIGTGKTTLCKAVLERLDRKTFTTFVPDPFVTREALLKMLLLDFGVMSVDDLKSGRMAGTSHPDLSYPLYDFLKSLVPLQAFAVLIIDEAQNLSASLLEEIRILSDLEAPDKLLQVVLIGQLELRAKLKLPEMRQLDQRVSARCSLEPLDREGVAGYISHRLSVAGGADDRVRFAPEAIDALFRSSGGVPRVVNLICDRALHRGHLARQHLIDTVTVSQAIEDLGVGTLTAAPSAAASPVLPTPVSTAAIQIAPTGATGAVLAPAAVLPAAAPVSRVASPAPSLTSSAGASISTDLSGLEVHDIEGSLHAPEVSDRPLYTKKSIFGETRPRKRLRWRLLRWAAMATAVFAIMFFALLGEAVFIHYFPPLAEQDLRLPGEPSAPRVPATISPIPIPADVTLRPPPPAAFRADPGATLIARP
jgi:general secretion pathway protein A